MTARDLEGLLRAGDPQDRSWIPPDFELVRVRAAAERVTPQARAAPPRRIVALGTIAAAATVAVAVAALALAPHPAPGGSSSSPIATTVPTLSASDRSLVAGAMGVSPEQVVATEDGAVAVRHTGSTLDLLVARRDPAAPSGWAVATIYADTGFSPGANGVDAVACTGPPLVRSVFVFGQLSQSDVASPLLLTGVPALQAANILGGDLVNGIYVFALRGPVAPGSLLTVTGPGAPQSHGVPGHPSFDGWAQVSIPGARACVGGASPSPAASTLSPDAAAALAAAEAYEAARAAGHWSTAWAMLSGYSQAQVGSLAAYEANETAYNRSGGTLYTIEPPTRNSDLLGVAFLGQAYTDAAAHVQIGRAWLVAVDHPDVAAASAGSVSLLLAPEGDQWLVWIAH